jgi:hypothetical protein
MTTLYCVLQANIGSGATTAQWKELFEAAKNEPFPQFLNWASEGTLAGQIFTSTKFSRGSGSRPDLDRYRLYGFGVEINAQTLVTDVSGPDKTNVRDTFITTVNYLRGRGIAPYASIPAPLDTNTVLNFVQTNNVRVADAGMAIANAYEQRYKIQLQDVIWTRSASTDNRTLIEATLEFSLRQAVLNSSLPDNQVLNLSVAEFWLGDEAAMDFRDYLAADYALGAASLWYALE